MKCLCVLLVCLLNVAPLQALNWPPNIQFERAKIKGKSRSFYDSQLIRVRVFSGLKKLKLAATSSFKIELLPSGKRIMKGYFLPNRLLELSEDGRLVLDQDAYRADGLKIVTKRQGIISINRRHFRGDVEIHINRETSTLDVINVLSLRSYLNGVLPREISPRWHKEALKAQAIVARTYAYYQIKSNQNPLYDLTADVYSQVYGGILSEDALSNQAVEQTDGLVMIYNGEIFPAYYHATCGDQTEDSNSLWEIDLPCLKMVDCGYCKKSPHYAWKAKLSYWDIAHAVKHMPGASTRALTRIEVLGRSDSGRATWMALHYEDGTVLKMSGNTLRLNVGPEVLRSTMFEFKEQGKKLHFKGKGWGHGVGLCQWGMKALAEQEPMRAVDILTYYYDQAEIVRLKGDPLPLEP